MTTLPRIALALALTGCIDSKPTSVGEPVAKAVLCAHGADADTARLKSQTCSTTTADSSLKQPAPPVRKP